MEQIILLCSIVDDTPENDNYWKTVPGSPLCIFWNRDLFWNTYLKMYPEATHCKRKLGTQKVLKVIYPLHLPVVSWWCSYVRWWVDCPLLKACTVIERQQLTHHAGAEDCVHVHDTPSDREVCIFAVFHWHVAEHKMWMIFFFFLSILLQLSPNYFWRFISKWLTVGWIYGTSILIIRKQGQSVIWAFLVKFDCPPVQYLCHA